MPDALAALTLFVRTGRLGPLDLSLVALYLVGITLFGLRFREKGGEAGKGRSLKSYFLADNTIPWWAIALSIVSAETSTLTIISIPGVAFAGDFGFLQVVIGYMLGRIVVAMLFLPRYFAGEMLTAYQLIDQRFGPTLHKVTAGLFLLTRAAAEGVRVFAVSIVVAIAIGTGDVLSIAIISALTLLYTFEGGMAAVVWTDVVQMGIYVFGTLVAVWSLGHHIPGGWATIHHVAGAAGKFHMLNFAFNLTQSYTFWAGVLGGTFLTMASHGTDQLMVQRLLAAKNLRESRLALLSSGVVIFIQFTLFLLIGAGLYVVAQQQAATYGIGHLYSEFWTRPFLLNQTSADRLFPTFIVREMPIGIAGLLVAAILAAAMSNLSAALNSLSSTTVVDFYMHLRPNADDRERNLISKSSTLVWALVLFAIAVATVSAGGKGHVVEIALSIASVAYGCLLGVFLLGTLTKFATEIGTSIGMVTGFALNLWLWQGTFPKTIGGGGFSSWFSVRGYPVSVTGAPSLTIPHIAFTWYVLIGAAVTFLVGALMSLIFRKKRTATQAATALLLFVILSAASRPCDAQSKDPEGQRPAITATLLSASAAPPSGPWALNPEPSTAPSTRYDFSNVSKLMTDAIAAHKLPGAVVVIGRNQHVLYQQAFGNRKLDGEPGLDGTPSPAEPMTEDTIFDMASLTKCLATATSIMQLYDAHKIASFDDPVDKYIPEFNPAHDATRAKVTLRLLLTHTSGEPPDVPLKDPWGLASPDKEEGFRRAHAAALASEPGTHFVYSDINFILLGEIVERLSGQPEDAYVLKNVFLPLGMTETRYLPYYKVCGPHKLVGAAIMWAPKPPGRILIACPGDTWSTSLLPRIAPTTHDDEGTKDTNLHFDLLTRGTVHDPTTRRMGGVAGHAGVFSTAHDVSLYAQALLDKLLRNTGPFPVSQRTLQLMVSPEQPPTVQNATILTRDPKAATPMLMAVQGTPLRGFGWDINTAFSRPRGAIFPTVAPSTPSAQIPSFGHTGFTGTTLWIDPTSDSYVILLSNAVHPRGATPISALRGEVATAAAEALSKPCERNTVCDPRVWVESDEVEVRNDPGYQSGPPDPTSTGIDVLERLGNSNPLLKLATERGAEPARCFGGHCYYPLRIGVLTNQSGIDAQGKRTIDILNSRGFREDLIDLETIFTPEHGLSAQQDTTHQLAEKDQATNLPVISLYGAHDADRRPSHAQLASLDAVVIDLQDMGTHFWTYESAMGYFLEAASTEKTQYHHDLTIVVLDRPNPVGGLAVQGPVSDPGRESYVNYMPLPPRNGMTFGELARYIVAVKHLDTTLVVIPMQRWQRSMFYADTGVPWVNPSPNLRSPETALLYPALGLIESTNISVGRGTDHPFSFFGAGIPPQKPSTSTATGGLVDSTANTTKAWFNAADVVAYLNSRNIPGVAFTATKEPIAEDANHYPFHGQTIDAVRVTLTDPRHADTPELGVEILSALHRLYPTQFNLARAMTLVCNQATMDAIARGDDPRAIAQSWQPGLAAFQAERTKILLY
ncbi:transporter, SSS family [Bryocella elongata]|uniref:Transporter, SSS family n=1 Tax=Bryocella elongata TaxID=863522 RepID=A0A1H5SG24_9BACT|nr:sodium/solute symporter [Bryocella elongata]SEF49546.1 transporter, SSS family [Bryocella elongata]